MTLFKYIKPIVNLMKLIGKWNLVLTILAVKVEGRNSHTDVKESLESSGM